MCSDERALRVLSNVLSELEIDVEHCPDHLSAAKKLAQRSFEAVIVDCKDEHGFALLGSVRSGKQNSKAMAIAIIEARTNLQTAFKLGANFVVFKPISTEKAKSSFRAARALMKRERRRSLRLQVNIAAYFRFQNGEGEHGSISGLSEGGMSVRFSSSNKKVSPIGFCFALPDTTTVIEADGTIAWQDARRHAGLQFAALPAASEERLKEWLRQQSGEKRDPPIHCTLICVNEAGCFLRTQSAFPVQTRVELLLRAADYSVKTQGKVRFMDPELGMGIEFLTPTVRHRHRLEELIQQIDVNPDAIAEVLVEPEGMDWEDSVADSSDTSGPPELVQELDPLLELFSKGSTLTKAEFLVELGKHELASSPTGRIEARPIRIDCLSAPGAAIVRLSAGADGQSRSTGLLRGVHRRCQSSWGASRRRCLLSECGRDRSSGLRWCRCPLSRHLGGRAGNSARRTNRPAKPND